MTISSILNNVIGPIMPGSSSSHTAGPYHIAKMFRGIVGELPKETVFMIEPGSSLECSYRAQGSDLAMIMGLLDLPSTHPKFKAAYSLFPEYGTDISFRVESFTESAHPNSIKISAKMQSGEQITAVADSTGGGGLLFRFLDDIPVAMSGDKYSIVTAVARTAADAVRNTLSEYECSSSSESGDTVFLQFDTPLPAAPEKLARLKEIDGLKKLRYAKPIFLPLAGERIFTSGEEMIRYAEKNGLSLGEAALAYESALLCASAEALNKEMDKRLQVMIDSVSLGLSDDSPQMFLLHSTAGKIMKAEEEGRLALGGIHSRACARAMAAMQVNSGQGIVCAAPTGGSAGVLPGIMVTLLEDMKKERSEVLKAMWAAGAIGLILSTRGTFAAEVCGCQVEIGAAGAMGAGAIVDIAGGTARQACDASAILFHNAMGLVCDLIQGTVEIPCHTRNASFASQAFVCADIILGGYHNSINLDETVDSIYAVGRMIPEQLRCTSLGGIAITESALKMPKLRV